MTDLPMMGGGGRIPERCHPPKVQMSAEIRGIVNAVLYPHVDVVPIDPWTLPVKIVDEAKKILGEYGPYLTPASDNLITEWFLVIASGVEFSPDKGEFMRRTSALVFGLKHVPHIAWTQEAQREGLLTWRRLPAVAQVADVIMPPVRPLISRVRALKIIARENP